MFNPAVLCLFTAVVSASPVLKRNFGPGPAEQPFNLVAVDSVGTAYPLTALFPNGAPSTGSSLYLYASDSGRPYTDTSLFDYSNGILITNHTVASDPDGPKVKFHTPTDVPANNSILALNSGDLIEPGFLEYYDSVFTSDTTFEPITYSWSLCQGNSVDQELERKVLYYLGTGPTCTAVYVEPSTPTSAA